MFIYNTEVEKGKKWNIILGRETSVNGVVLTPFNSLTPHQFLLNSLAFSP